MFIRCNIVVVYAIVSVRMVLDLTLGPGDLCLLLGFISMILLVVLIALEGVY